MRPQCCPRAPSPASLVFPCVTHAPRCRCIPIRDGPAGELEVLMVSSRRGEGLIFPKARTLRRLGLGQAVLLRSAHTGRRLASLSPERARLAPRRRGAPAGRALTRRGATQGGWETDETAAEAAARESLEEAGVRGDLQARRPRHAAPTRTRAAPRGPARRFPKPTRRVLALAHWPRRSRTRRSWAASRSPAKRAAAWRTSSSCALQRSACDKQTNAVARAPHVLAR